MKDVVSSMLDALPPEGRLIVECISISSKGESRTRAIEQAAPGLDWERLLDDAAGHCVIPAVHNALAECADLAPDSTTKRLRFAYACNTIQQTCLTRELVQVSNDLAAVGAWLIALKGPALAIQAYGRVEARQSGDLDILIRASDLPQIVKVLAKRGYCGRGYEKGPLDMGFFGLFEDEFVSERGVIDLHLDLLPSYFPLPRDQESIRRNAVNINLEGGDVSVLAPRDQLIFSILHATKHGWGYGALRSMCDIAALTANGLVDWEETEEEMARLGYTRMCRLGAVLAHKFAGAAVPENVLRRSISDLRVMRLAAGIARNLFPAPPLLRCDWYVPLTALQGLRRRLRYLLTRTFRPTIDDWEALPLPKTLYWAYYLARPMRLMIHHRPRLFPPRPQLTPQ
jgi:Uncharacterised nucleotidyltransferase